MGDWLNKGKKNILDESSFEFKLICIFLAIGLGVVLLILVKTTSLFNEIAIILRYNLGSLLMDNLKIFFRASFTLSIFAFCTFFLFNLAFSPKKIRWSLIITVSFMIFLFLFGFWFIQEFIGYKNIRFNLQSDDPLGRGLVKCDYGSNLDLAGNEVNCEVTTVGNLHLSYIVVTFTSKDNSEKNLYFYNESMQFIAPANLRYILFEVFSYDSEEKDYLSSVGYPHTFPTLKEYEENKRIFLGYILALVALIFVTIPSAVSGLRSLWKE